MESERELRISTLYQKGLVSFSIFPTSNPTMRALLDQARRLAASDASVLILGESGVGKNLLAQAIHNYGTRSGKVFCEFNCGGVTETLQESELFGHVRGAFTDARDDRPGVLELADGGTLFLNEVGDLPLSTQKKLLDVIEYRKFRRVGDTKDHLTDIRVVAATNRDVDALAKAGEFRQDFLFRLNAFRLEVPPLRNRLEDLPEMTTEFLREFSWREKKEVTNLSPKALGVLKQYSWPGNVRQLRYIIWRGVVGARSGVLEEADIKAALVTEFGSTAKSSGPRTLREVEREYILEILRMTGGNKTRAAEILKISRFSLRRKIQEYRIPAEEP